MWVSSRISLLVVDQGDVVALELLLAVLEGTDDGVDHRRRALVAGEIALEWRAHARDAAQQTGEPAGLQVVLAGVELLHLDLEVHQGVGDLAAVLAALVELGDRLLEHLAAVGSLLLELGAHRLDGGLGPVLGIGVGRRTC